MTVGTAVGRIGTGNLSVRIAGINMTVEEEGAKYALELIRRYAKKYNWSQNKVVYILAQWVGECADMRVDDDLGYFDLYLRTWDEHYSFEELDWQVV